MYDIFLINFYGKEEYVEKIRAKFPLAKQVKSFREAQQNSLTSMFWVIWNDLTICDDFTFDYRVPEWDREYIHVFRNGNFYDGICLVPKKAIISNRELEYRFFTNKKEIDQQASVPNAYDIFHINTYEDYLLALDKSKTDMFWIIPNEVIPLSDFQFDIYFDWHNSIDRKSNHVFKNKDIDDIKYNGIMLLSKHKPVSKREIEHRFLVERKEHDIVASIRFYDIVFISYNESNADDNFLKLKEKFPRAQRIHGVKGIHQAHIAAAKLSSTPMFWVVDGDAEIDDDFKFDFLLPEYDRDTVYVWRSRNPINDLEYGYGGVKLLPTDLTLNVDVNSTDMTTSISKKFKAVEKVSNVTKFNTDPFNTWKSAFRECVKLSSRVIDNQKDQETEKRLETWMTVGLNRPFGKFAIDGANYGNIWGKQNKGNHIKLSLINDFDWIKSKFEEQYGIEYNNNINRA